VLEAEELDRYSICARSVTSSKPPIFFPRNRMRPVGSPVSRYFSTAWMCFEAADAAREPVTPTHSTPVGVKTRISL
jgi:hypothetical protein